MVTANFAEFYARARLIVWRRHRADRQNIWGVERLFRLGIVSNLVTFASVVDIGAGSLPCSQAHQ